MSYTKGPWVYSKHRDTHDCCIHQAGAVEKYGYIGPENGGVVGSSEWIWLDEDDGYLIAAAPDLYEALKEMRNFMAWKYGEDDPFVKTADRAMSKAEGRSND